MERDKAWMDDDNDRQSDTVDKTKFIGPIREAEGEGKRMISIGGQWFYVCTHHSGRFA